MGGQGNQRSEQGGRQLRSGGELLRRSPGHEAGQGYPYKGVQGVPDEIEGRNLVGKKLQSKERAGDNDNRPRFNEMQRRGKRQGVESSEKPEGEQGRVDVQAGGEAGADHNGEDFRLVKRHGIPRKNEKAAGFPAALQTYPALQSRFDLESPGFQQRLGNILRVLVPAGPLTQPRGADILIGRELEFLHPLLE